MLLPLYSNILRKMVSIGLFVIIFNTGAIASDLENSGTVISTFPWSDGYVVKHVKVVDERGYEYWKLLIECNGKAAIKPGSGYQWVLSDQIENFPVHGCRTLQVTTFTGGTGCCAEVYFLTKCRQGGVTITHFGVENWEGVDYREKENHFDANGDGTKEILLQDGNGKDGPPFPAYQSSYFHLSQTEYFLGPAWQRLGVYDTRSHSWRVDKRGEYAAFYEKLFYQCQKQDKEDGEVFICSYYLYMMGKPKKLVKDYVYKWVLNKYKKSPEIKEYLKSADNIMEFVFNSAEKFNPFHRTK